jgi:hypothetical protein
MKKLTPILILSLLFLSFGDPQERPTDEEIDDKIELFLKKRT